MQSAVTTGREGAQSSENVCVCVKHSTVGSGAVHGHVLQLAAGAGWDSGGCCVAFSHLLVAYRKFCHTSSSIVTGKASFFEYQSAVSCQV